MKDEIPFLGMRLTWEIKFKLVLVEEGGASAAMSNMKLTRAGN